MLDLVEIGVLCLWWPAYIAYSLDVYLSSWLLACYPDMLSL
jgi:hypothetical protein